MQVRVRVSVRAAIMARSLTAGIIPVEINAEDLKALDEDELAALADIVEADEVLEQADVGVPTYTTVRDVLSTRAAAARAVAEAAKQAEEARLAGEAERVRLEAEGLRRSQELEAARKLAIHKWVEDHGDDDQRGRFREGFLEDSEVIDDVMHALFEINEEEYSPLARHMACDCDRGCSASVKFTVGPPVGGMDSRQFATLERIREAAPDGASVTPQLHKASCPDCGCAPIARLSALVVLPWNGWELQKEYSLG